MKLLAASILILLALSASLAFTAVPASLASPASTALPNETCSCEADDETCSASVSCRGGCIAWCPTDGCVAQCLDNGDGSTRVGFMSRSVTLRLKGSKGREVSAELARVTGEDVAFTPWTTGATVDLDLENVPAWSALEVLSQSGRIQISGVEFSNIKKVRRTLLSGGPISLCAHGMTARRFANELRFMTGLDIQIMSGDPKSVVNYNGRGVTLNDIVAQVSERTQVQLAVR